MKVVILTEGGRSKGFGHVARCLSLRAALLESGSECGIFVDGDDTLDGIMAGVPWERLDWVNDRSAVNTVISNADIVVVDSYFAALHIYDLVADSNKLAVFFDDTRRLPYPCGYVINAGIGAANIGYPSRQGVRYFLGLDYACLRRVFWDIAPSLIRPKVKKVFLSFGAVDSKNILSRILNACVVARPDLTYVVVVGLARKDILALETYREASSVEFIEDVPAQDLVGIMQSADVAVSACGQTIYELAKAGVPSVAVKVNENQHLNWQGMVGSGAVYDGGVSDEALEKCVLLALEAMQGLSLRQAYQDTGRRLIDGQGARRITNILLKRN